MNGHPRAGFARGGTEPGLQAIRSFPRPTGLKTARAHEKKPTDKRTQSAVKRIDCDPHEEYAGASPALDFDVTCLSHAGIRGMADGWDFSSAPNQVDNGHV